MTNCYTSFVITSMLLMAFQTHLHAKAPQDFSTATKKPSTTSNESGSSIESPDNVMKDINKAKAGFTDLHEKVKKDYPILYSVIEDGVLCVGGGAILGTIVSIPFKLIPFLPKRSRIAAVAMIVVGNTFCVAAGELGAPNILMTLNRFLADPEKVVQQAAQEIKEKGPQAASSILSKNEKDTMTQPHTYRRMALFCTGFGVGLTL